MLTERLILDTSWTTKEDRSTTNISKLADMIMHDVHFAKNERGLYYYDEGRYKPNGEEAVEELYLQLLKSFDAKTDYRPRRGLEIADYIKLESKPLLDRPKPYLINLKNGVYDLERNKFFKHTPAYRTTVQIPIDYDPDATCSVWDQFLSEVLPYPGGPNYLREIIGLCMTPFTGLQKCIILVGAGSNGKSTYLNGMQAAIGLENVSNIPLHSLTNPLERFARSGLVGKLVNIFGDMSSRRIEDAAAFKPLVGEDRILIEQKHKEAYYYTPFCKLIFSCNEVVGSDDDTDGYKRRFIHVPFTQRFKVDPKVGQELSLGLADPKQLSGLLNLILPSLYNVLENGLTITPQIAGIIDEWCPVPEETETFLKKTLVLDPAYTLPMQRFYDWYVERAPCVEPFERAKLVRYIKYLFPDIEVSKVSRVNGIPTRCYQGIRIVDLQTHSLVCSWVNVKSETEESLIM